MTVFPKESVDLMRRIKKMERDIAELKRSVNSAAASSRRISSSSSASGDSHSDLSGVSANQHHAQDHASRHAVAGGDAITIVESQISDLRSLIDDDTFATATSSNVASAESIKAYVDSVNHVGLANKVNMMGVPVSQVDYGAGDEAHFAVSSEGSMTNINTGTINLYYHFAFPITKGSLTAFHDDVFIGIIDADANNYVSAVYLYGIKSNGTTITQIGSDLTNLTTTGEKVIGFTPSSLSGYKQIWVRLECVTDTELALAIQVCGVQIYYA